MTDDHMESTSSEKAAAATVSTDSLPSLVRGRPRSTSISSGSPNPAPGVPLPSLFPDPAPAPPQLSHSSSHNFPFSFPSNSTTASSSLTSNFGPPWGKMTTSSTGSGSGGGGGGGAGHRSSLSVPGIISPSPLAPGAVPRGGRHRRTQSVSPPGFSMGEEGGTGENSNVQAVESRRSSEPNLPVSKAEGSIGIPISSSPRQPRLNISTSIGTRLSHQRSPSSPTRSPRAKPPNSVPTSTMSSSPTNQSHFEQQQSTHPHLVHHSHHPQHPHLIPISSHAALLQGVRSHALPHSPTLDAMPGHHHDVSPLSTSPSIPHYAGFAARRLSGGQSSSTRPSFSTTLAPSLPNSSSGSTSPASPPFGPTSPSINGRLSPLPFDISRPHSTTAARDENLRHLALDQAMTDAILDQESTSPPPAHSFQSRRRSSSGSSHSPPLFPLPFDLGTPASPRGGTRSRSGSIGRAVSSSTSPASLFLDEDQGESSPNEMKDGSPCEVYREEIDIARPPSPPMVTDSLFPVSGTLPPPSPPATTLSSLGFDIPSPIAADSPLPSSPSFSTSPVLSGLSSSRPSPHPPNSSSTTSSPLPDSDPLPPASPHRGPISLPPPLNAPTPLPPHLIGGSAARSRSRSRSREREKERKREKSRSRSRSGSREREVQGEIATKERPRSPAGMRLTGLEFVPKVHSPLASPPATEPRECSKMIQVEVEEEKDPNYEGGDNLVSEMSTEGANPDSMSIASLLPPPIPPPSTNRTISSTLRLPHLAIPSASSPVGTPEHLEESPTSSESYFALAPGAALARSPPPLPEHLATLPTLPPLERAPSWEDELDDDDFDDSDHDGTGEVGYTLEARRKSSGTKTEEERVSLLEALGISKTDLEREKEREMAEQEAERRRVEQERQERDREERAREEERERQREFSALGFMDVDLETQELAIEQEAGSIGEAGEAGDLSIGDVETDALQIDEDSLSALERIFVCAKSEAVEERARVAHFLADWVPAVEICEAVEYVLPLLAGLIEDEMVKEVFAPQLDRVMWYFFSHCPLAELDSHSEKASSCTGSPVPSRYKSRSNSLITDNSPDPSVCGPSDRSTTPPPTSETSPTQSHADTSSPNLPRISVTTFTALLGALLTDQSTTVAKATEAAVVRFLCRLKDKPIPLESPSEDSLEFTPSSQPLVLPELSISEPDPHSSYAFTNEARQVLEDEVVSGIVIGLARLDEDDHEVEQAQTQHSQYRELDKTRTNEIKEDEIENPVLFTSPEEHSFEDVHEGTDEEMKFFSDWRHEHSTSESSAVAMPLSRSPPDQVLSSFSPEQPADEEASIGKMVSMSLIGAIAAANCLDSSVLVKHFLPEVQRMKAESMFYVRKEAVQALGNLATVVPTPDLESSLLPLHTFFSQDQVWHVRRAAVLALPAVCKPLSRASLRTKAIEAIRHFSVDDNRNVRSGALEIAGELIFLFHEDPQGVPEELLSFFLGTSLDSNQPRELPSRPFSHFRSALESPPNSFLDTSNSWQSPGFFGRETRDADRPILTAFNFPAVVLTLGRHNWNLVKDHHLALCKDPVEKARQSLASSLHEVAKIVGTDHADACLLEPLSWFLQDAENVQTAILENVSTLLMSFGGGVAKKALLLFGDSWIDIVNWRLREQALKKIADFGPHFMQNDGEEQVLLVLSKAFKDSVASVRDQATVVIPPLLNAVLDRPASLSKLLAFLNVYRTDSSYRNRVAYVSSVVACVRASLPRDIFELHFLDSLVELARDKVVSVRIAVSRVIHEACQCLALYSDPSTRSALREVLSILAASSDRDVRLPILEFYDSTSASQPSPPSNQASPEATKPNRYIYGVNIDESPRAECEEDSTMNDDSDDQDDSNMSEFELSTSTSLEGDGVLLEKPPQTGEDEDEEEEEGFVELSRP